MQQTSTPVAQFNAGTVELDLKVLALCHVVNAHVSGQPHLAKLEPTPTSRYHTTTGRNTYYI
jgi:hypothetical protein